MLLTTHYPLPATHYPLPTAEAGVGVVEAPIEDGVDVRLGGEMVERGGGGHAADDIDETQARLRNSRDLIHYYCYLLLTPHYLLLTSIPAP